MKHTVIPVSLNSGGKGLLVDVPGSTVIDMEFTFLSGFKFVEKAKYEVPHSMEHLIFGANKYYKDAQSFSREFGLNGAYHNAYTNSELNGYVAEVAAFEWRRVMELFWKGLTTPKFLNEEFKTEQETIVEELSSRLMDYHSMISIELVKAMGDDHVLDYQTRINQLPEIVPDDLRIHHQQTHSSTNMRFIVAGNLRGQRAEILQLLERYSSQLPEGDRKKKPVEHLIQPLGPVVINKDVDKNFFDIRTGSHGELSERESVALDMLIYTLTGAWDSRIFGQGRKKGLLYHIFSAGGSSGNTTGFWLAGSVMPSKTDALLNFVADELKKLRQNGISIDELKSAKQYLLGSFQISHQTTQSLVNWYARYFTYDEYYNFDERLELIKSITRRDMQRVVDKLFSDNYWGFGILGKNLSEAKTSKYYATQESIWR